MAERTFNDSRYNSFDLSNSIPSARTSVKHTQELDPHPAEPRSFIPSNRSREPVEFSRATEEYDYLGFHLPRIYNYHLCYGGRKPDSFYFEALATFRRNCGSLTRDRMAAFRRTVSYTPEPPQAISQFPIFRLPQYCVDQILSYLSGPDLAVLAFIDKDCRQLARTRQFRSVWIDFSSASLDLLRMIVHEACDRIENHRSSPRWTLGACIRRITVACQSAAKESTPQTSWVDARRRSHEAVECHQSHMNSLEIAIQEGLPNLEFLDWADKVPITSIFTKALLNSQLTRLELHYIIPCEDFDFLGSGNHQMYSVGQKNLRLRRLVLSLNSFFKPGGFVLFTKSLLKLVAPTLEELVWDGSAHRADDKYSFGSDPIIFKRLKKLHMIRVQVEDEVVLSSFFPISNAQQGLTHLCLNSQEKKLGPFFAKRGHIPSLTHLNWIDFALYQDIDSCISFFAANPQLQTFRFDDTKPKLTDDLLIPMFSSNFTNLTSLALVWEATMIPPESLGLIAKITTLKHLWLSAWVQWGDKLDWIVNHNSLRKDLSPLKQLEWFVLTRDGYENGNEHLRFPNQLKPQEWEDSHRRLMQTRAKKFARLHPKLEWVHFGQIPMSIKRTTRGTEVSVTVVPLMAKREDCTMLLSEMWGEDRQDWVFQA